MNKDNSLFVYLLLVAMLDIKICSQCQTVIKLVEASLWMFKDYKMHKASILILGIFSYWLNGKPGLGISLFFNMHVCRMWNFLCGQPRHFFCVHFLAHMGVVYWLLHGSALYGHSLRRKGFCVCNFNFQLAGTIGLKAFSVLFYMQIV